MHKSTSIDGTERRKPKMMICGVCFHRWLRHIHIALYRMYPLVCFPLNCVPATMIILSIFQLENLLSDININILMVCKTQGNIEDRHSILH